jgi:hypothetical protein
MASMLAGPLVIVAFAPGFTHVSRYDRLEHPFGADKPAMA